jgi:hypothetical protein
MNELSIQTTSNIISAYFVDIYYKKLFIQAQNYVSEEKFKTINDAYKNIIIQYYEFAKNSKDIFITNSLKYITISITSFTNQSCKDIKECINLISCDFIPIAYQDKLTQNKKKNILSDIIIRTLSKFNNELINNSKINIILDSSEDKNKINDNIQQLIHIFSSILRNEVNLFFTSKDNKYSTSDINNIKIQYQNQIKILNNNIEKLQGEKNYLITSYKKLLDKSKQIVSENKYFKEQNIKLLQQINILKEQVELIKDTKSPPKLFNKKSEKDKEEEPEEHKEEKSEKDKEEEPEEHKEEKSEKDKEEEPEEHKEEKSEKESITKI